CMDGDAQKLEALLRSVPIALIARDAVNVFGDKNVKALALGSSHHLLIAGSVGDRRTRDGAVLEDRNHFEARREALGSLCGLMVSTSRVTGEGFHERDQIRVKFSGVGIPG